MLLRRDPKESKPLAFLLSQSIHAKVWDLPPESLAPVLPGHPQVPFLVQRVCNCSCFLALGSWCPEFAAGTVAVH